MAGPGRSPLEISDMLQSFNFPQLNSPASLRCMDLHQLNQLLQVNQLLQTDLDCSSILSCEFAFLVNDGRSEYETAIYRHFLNAVAACELTGQMLVYAGDALIKSAKPIYMLQVVPVLGEATEKLNGITREEFQKLRDAVNTATATDSGLHFMVAESKMGEVLSVDDALLPMQGNVGLREGQVMYILCTHPQATIFELECLQKYPGIPAEPYYDEGEGDDDEEEGAGNLVVQEMTADELMSILAITDRHKDFLEANNINLTLQAARCYKESGRGSLCVKNKSGKYMHPNKDSDCYYVKEEYLADGRHANLKKTIAQYNPETHFVVCIDEGDTNYTYCLEGGLPRR